MAKRISRAATVRRQIADEQFTAAFATLADYLLDDRESLDDREAAWREFLLGSHSLLLKAGRQWHREGQATEGRTLLGKLFDTPQFLDSARQRSCDWRRANQAVDAQLLILDAVLELPRKMPGQRSQEQLLRDAIRKFHDAWQYPLPRDTTEITQRPACVECLPTANLKTLLDKLAREFGGWGDPALVMTAEALAWLMSERAAVVPAADWTVKTYIAVAGAQWVEERSPRLDEESPPKPEEAEKNELVKIPLGVLARLKIERIPNGCGTIYPDPLTTGLLRTLADFQIGIQNARRVVFSDAIASQTCRYDFRWSLEVSKEVENSERMLPLHTTLDGRSGEVAFACAWKAALTREPLDEQVAITACFQNPDDANPTLGRVGEIKTKLMALFQQELVDELLVAEKQPEAIDPVTKQPVTRTFCNDKLWLIPVVDFHAAYERLGRYARLTARAKRVMRRRCERLLDFLERPYVLNPLARHVPKRDLNQPTDRDYEVQPLAPEEINNLLLGRLPREANRVRLFADSGFGKSTLLIWCELQMASDPQAPLPLRLGATFADVVSQHGTRKLKPLPLLSSITWSGSTDEVLVRLADRLLPDFFDSTNDEPTEVTKEQRLAWLKTLVRRGQIAFLLDAIDQTKEDQHELATFLESVDARDCPTLLAGRPETKQTRANTFGESIWDTVFVEPFQEPQIREYLGEAIAAQLLTKHEWRDAWSAQTQQWWPLLEVPLLLREMRKLANRNELAGLKNREGVYDRAVSQLIKKGLSSDKASSGHQPAWDELQVRNLLADVAWQTILHEDAADNSSGQFTGRISGEAFSQFRQHYESQLAKLAQIDLTTLSSLFEEDGFSELAWRHFSFCEYFAAAKLIKLPADEQDTVLKRHARDVRWRWIFRFAISMAERKQLHAELWQLATGLIRYGGVFALWPCVKEDRIVGFRSAKARAFAEQKPTIPDINLDQLCRWLVHRDIDGLGAWDDAQQPPLVNEGTLEILADVFHRDYRDSRCLHPAWELVSTSEFAAANAIRSRFLGEFRELVSLATPSADCAVLQLLPDEELVRLGYLTADELGERRPEQRNFCRCPGDPREDKRPFLMGSPKGEGDGDERPQHAVLVSPFFCQRGQVTNGQFDLFDPSHRQWRDEYSDTDPQPVNNVSWYMATMFAIWLDGYFATGARTVKSWSIRLPTEAEWEYACRAGTTTSYAVGNGRELTENDANVDRNVGATTVAGRYPANAWGLHDMHGNLWDWCEDWYGAYPTARPDVPLNNPTGANTGSSRVLRGGSWLNGSRNCRSAYRARGSPGNRLVSNGIRVVFALR